MNSIDRVREALKSVSGWNFAQAKFSSLPGGVTNRTWLAESGNDCCVVRLNATHAGIVDFDRECEFFAHTNAAKMNIAPAIIHFDDENGILVTEYLAGAVWNEKDLGVTTNFDTVAQLLRRVHDLPACGKSLDLNRSATQYERYLQKRDGLHAFAIRCVDVVRNLYTQHNHVCCHNDIVAANIIGHKEPKLIDWEYAGDNDPYFDLASLIGYHGLDSDSADRLLDAYTGGATSEHRERLSFQIQIYDAIQWLWLAVRHLDKPSRGQSAMLEKIQQRIR